MATKIGIVFYLVFYLSSELEEDLSHLRCWRGASPPLASAAVCRNWETRSWFEKNALGPASNFMFEIFVLIYYYCCIWCFVWLWSELAHSISPRVELKSLRIKHNWKMSSSGTTSMQMKKNQVLLLSVSSSTKWNTSPSKSYLKSPWWSVSSYSPFSQKPIIYANKFEEVLDW